MRKIFDQSAAGRGDRVGGAGSDPAMGYYIFDFFFLLFVLLFPRLCKRVSALLCLGTTTATTTIPTSGKCEGTIGIITFSKSYLILLQVCT